MRTSLATLLVCLALPALISAAAPANPEVEKGVRALAVELRRTWDAKDINAYMACFGKPEGLLIWGGTAKTLDEVRADTQKAWSDRTSDSWTNDKVDVIVIDNNTALLQITYSGRYTLQSGATWEFKSSSFSTALVRKTGGRWKVVANHGSARGTQVNATKKQ